MTAVLDTSTATLRSILIEGARAAYGTGRTAHVCVSCGCATDDVDGYDIPTPFGTSWICLPCNLVPAFWNEDVFVGPITKAVA